MNNPRDLILQRKVSREIFMKYMYQKAISNEPWVDLFHDLEKFISLVEEDAMEIFKEYGGRDLEQLENFRDLVIDTGYLMDISNAIEENFDEINSYINQYARNWTIDTLPIIDVAILRIAIAEIKFMYTIPDSVSCNVAVELAKKYCDDGAYKYINGILGSVAGKKSEHKE